MRLKKLKAANIPEEDVQRDVTVIMPPLDLLEKQSKRRYYGRKNFNERINTSWSTRH